jgi:LysR family transcriptional regulator for metE and metH
MILETRHLHMIAAVAEHGTLTRASHELNLTQSAISHQLITLEARLRTSLFHRLGRRMVLTNAGTRVLTAAQRTLGELRAAEEELGRLAAGQTGLLRVSTECYTSYHWMPRVMRSFGARVPSVEVQIVADATGDPIAALHDGRIDLAVMMNRHVGTHLRAYPLFTDELVLVTAKDHPFATRRFVELSDLASEHLLTYSPLASRSSFMGQLLAESGIKPRRESTIQLTEAIVELVESGLGVAVLARWAIAPRLATGSLAAIRVTAAGIRRQWYAVTLRRSAAGSHAREFAALLAQGPAVLEPAVHRAPGASRRRRLAAGAR